MAKHRIFSVGFELPGDAFEFVPFESDQTLLDADIILFEPTFGDYYPEGSHNGRALLSEQSSFAVKKSLDHWCSEIIAAVNAGKLVVVYLTKPVERYRYTGQTEDSGTGRNARTKTFVTEVTSYEAVPNLKKVIPKSGTETRLDKDAKYLIPYWKEFSSYSHYEVEIDGEFRNNLLKSRSGDRIVGAAVHSRNGVLLFLPPLRYDEEQFVRYDGRSKESVWTDHALEFGNRLVATLISLADSLNKSTQHTPAPAWSSNSTYRLIEEGELESTISKCTIEIAQLLAKKNELEEQLQEAGSLRRLLYEQGKPLEGAILEAMKLFGFEAEPFTDGKSEFDVVFFSDEGRCLGEAEGKDSKLINIAKFSQLERNLHEDFAREEVTEYAKGVLFGNANRLLPPDQRGEFFTEKCVSAAKRTGAALVRTPDLFVPAKYLTENSAAFEYAKQCREAIIGSEGQVVTFPSPPFVETSVLVESASSDVSTAE